MHVGLIAPPWIPVPPPAYGGTEAVIATLANGLKSRGVEVTLFAHPESTAPVRLRSAVPPREGTHIGDLMSELAWAASADEALAECDVIHHHSFAGVACSSRTDGLVMTNHGPFEPHMDALLRRVARTASVVAISNSHAEDANVPVTVIHHGVEIEQFPFGDGAGGYLLFLGRLDATKGAHRAIEVARRAGRPLIIAAKMREPHERKYFHDEIEPRLGDGVTYIREPRRNATLKLLAGATALVNPILWKEPFGMVMLEAQACGTPVLAFGCGAAPELVRHGSTGFISTTVDEMVDDVARIGEISRRAVRTHAETSFSADRMVDQYLDLYEAVGDQTSLTAAFEQKAG